MPEEIKLCFIYAGYALAAAEVYTLAACLLWPQPRQHLRRVLGQVGCLLVLGVGFSALLLSLGGVLRWYVPVALAIGLWCYDRLLLPWLNPLHYLWQRLWLALYRLVHRLGRMLTNGGRKVVKYAKKVGKKAKKVALPPSAQGKNGV